MTNKELINQAISNMSDSDKAQVFPPITRKNFVVRKSWLGRNQDEVLNVMLPKLSIMPCWIKRGYWSQSTNLPTTVRHLADIVETIE